jgi:hypothetical protein
MPDSSSTQQLFDSWKKQFDEGASAWTRFMKASAQPGTAPPPDPMNWWRPMMEQFADTWMKAVQGGVAPDALAQWKAYLDQWIATWDKMLTQTMQTDAFAETLGRQLDRWLAVQSPMRKAVSDSTEAALKALDLPSRQQVIGIARQLTELDDRLEDIENRLAALDAHAPAHGPHRGDPLREPGAL